MSLPGWLVREGLKFGAITVWGNGNTSMTSFIHYKKKKIEHVFQVIGADATETEFIDAFKSLYPEDWQNIQDKWLYEEQNTPAGKKHPMQPPEIYMKVMYRNHRPE